ncbi:hypothetical protein [Microcystis aeruginosa]|uniref:Similar to the Nter part of Q3MEQ6_ANAVT Hypothetical protein n=1 Tax=Microcystis aeruginosa (strain PCC 7806) TaxID=267872 RepID=A8YJV0_MICA7|nr:hypothetical protein [Microcystis aeruginosa]ELS48647.1 hypothetical protein C789_1540 [Microcystis aeruginosa FACHB-905 = DIANCHI905]CAO90220.1 unnamed protein product [Microcystis aeruginosa PCC 7806]
MQAILLSREEVAQRAEKLYESRIRQEVEVEENRLFGNCYANN